MMARSPSSIPELVCPAGTPAGLRTAVDAGAHSVYCGFRDETNARNFPGLNFSPAEMAEAIGLAHRLFGRQQSVPGQSGPGHRA